MRQENASLWKPTTVALGAAMSVAGAGGLMTDIGPWYRKLRKPSWRPPTWLYGPAWGLIYVLTAFSAALAWRSAKTKAARGKILLLFAANGFLNVLWSALFFEFKRPDWALLEAGFLWVSVLIPIIVLGRYSWQASLLLIPYLLWVTFATILNEKIVEMNPRSERGLSLPHS